MDIRYIFACLLLCSIFDVTTSMKEVEVYRLYGLQKGNQIFGGKIASLNLVAAHFKGDVLRKISLIRFQELTIESIQQTITKRASGILIILPERNTEVLEQNEKWQIVQSQLLSKTIFIPVYFVWENEDINNLYEQQKKRANGTINSKETDQYKISVTVEEP